MGHNWHGEMQTLTLWVVGQSEQADARGADSRPEHRDSTRVSAEVTDVLTDPAQGLNLIQEPVVPLRCLVTGAEEAWSAHTDNST